MGRQARATSRHGVPLSPGIVSVLFIVLLMGVAGLAVMVAETFGFDVFPRHVAPARARAQHLASRETWDGDDAAAEHAMHDRTVVLGDDAASFPRRRSHANEAGCPAVKGQPAGLSKKAEGGFVARYTPQWGYHHMAMIEPLPNGTMVAMWQAGRRHEGETRQSILWSTADVDTGDDDLEWAPPRVVPIPREGGGALWGPCLLVDAEAGAGGKLWLFYSESRGECGAKPPTMEWAPGGDIKAMSYDLTTDTWSAPRLLLSQDADAGIPKVTANKPAVLSDGSWVLPYWRERSLIGRTRACAKLAGQEGAGVLISRDKGETWSAHGNIKSAAAGWLIENAVVELGPGKDLLMIFRTKASMIYQSKSEDGGVTWSDAKPLGRPGLPNPNAKIDMIKLDVTNDGGASGQGMDTDGEDGDGEGTSGGGGSGKGSSETVLVVAFNDHPQPPRATLPGCLKCRTRLSLALSRDGGVTWRRQVLLESEVGSSLRFHYPTLAQVGCHLYVAYSRFYSKKIEPNDPGGSFEQQGIIVKRVEIA